MSFQLKDPLTWQVMNYCQSSVHANTRPVCGVYAICGWTIDEYYGQSKPSVYYIGASANVARRLNNHPKEDELNHLYLVVRFYFECSTYLETEKSLIQELRPPLNITYNG